MDGRTMSRFPLFYCSTLAYWLALAPALASTPLASADPSLMATMDTPGGVSQNILIRTSTTGSAFQNHYQAGLEALEQRIYGQAQLHLKAALAELRKHNISDEQTLRIKLSLAQAFLGEEQYDHAEHYFVDAAAQAHNLHQDQLEFQSLSGLGETFNLLGENTKAHQTVERAQVLDDRTKCASPLDRAHLFETLGAVLSAQGLHQQALASLRQSVQLYESHSDEVGYSLANARLRLAIELQEDGQQEESARLLPHALSGLAKEAKFQVPPYAAPRFTVHWETGDPRSREIADNDYPLRYALVNNLRVAATLVRSENVIVAIISLANCGHARLPLAIGPVTLDQITPKRKPFLYVSPHELDIPLEERHITDLTWRRRWLNHIEKNRYIPGYLKNNVLDVDNFFGNNQVGEYGNWPTIACDDTPIVTREEYLFGGKLPQETTTANFLSRGITGYHPTYLDPGYSKTGFVYFKQERFDEGKLSIGIGNTVVEIPFYTAGPRE
jgi:tetratricopeptide (TPR) repeat protein